MVGHERVLGGDAARVLLDRDRVDAARDRAAREDLLLHSLGARDRAVVGDRGVRVLGQAGTLSARWEGGARPGDVLGGASPVGSAADALLRLGRAGQVRLLRFVRDAGASLRELVQPLVRPIN